MSKIEVSFQTLDEVLCDTKKFYQVPDFQRPYKWGKDEVDRLMNDIFDEYKSNDEGGGIFLWSHNNRQERGGAF